jgi:hypothetical protein
VFIVLHMQPGFASVLPEMLSRRGPLRAAHAIHPSENGDAPVTAEPNESTS